MQIESVGFGKEIVQVFAREGKQRFEFTSFRGGPIEVYDFPKAWKGIPRQIGYLTQEQGSKLGAIVLEQKPDLDCRSEEIYANGRFDVKVLIVEGLGFRFNECRPAQLVALFESRFGGAWRSHRSAVA